MKTVLYMHGKGGSPEEAAHYQPLFPEDTVLGMPYLAETPWDAKAEFPGAFDALCPPDRPVILIANSIGAFLAMQGLADKPIERAFFISPIVDMEQLIGNMLTWAGETEETLCEKQTIPTAFGETLSWEYLTYVRAHPIEWHIPTNILYGGRDDLTSPETMSAFADHIGAALTVMPGGEHWFHTEEQMQFLDGWLRECLAKKQPASRNVY